MNTTTMTPTSGADRAALLRAAKGQPAPTSQVPMGIRATVGPGVPATPTPAPAPPVAEARRSMDELLRVAADSEAARTRQFAAKITALMAELTERVEAEETTRREREAAEKRRQELAEAEAALASKLAEVRQELRSTGRRDSAASPSRNRRAGADDRAKIRAWALANGYQVKDRGRLSREIREAYAAATASEVDQ
ncbi:histone-like nucleoid-structuring protein Lsr2 [Micromonospora sp. NPDC049051]|uniref:Lsr2 family DNA-binding protein n=1 Tax=Micromonospora sp. NPDC049051 TaxID=3364264 RepID=UPI003719D3CC